jgi:hypothetical protein
LRRKARVKVALVSCVTGTLALLVAVTAQAYLNKEVEARWNGYGSISFAASNDDLVTGGIASAMSSDAPNPTTAVAELRPALSPALLLESEPARRGLLAAVAPEPDHDCPPAAPAATAAEANAPTAAMDKGERVAQVAAQIAPQATSQEAAPQLTAEVTVTRAGTRQTVYTVVREKR